MESYMAILVAALVFLFLIILARKAGSLKKLLFNIGGGLAAFGAVNLTGLFTGVTLVPNLLTVCTAVFLGLPGVAGILLLKVILQV